MQVIFQIDFHDKNLDVELFNYLNEQPLSKEDLLFADTFIKGLLENQEKIDKTIINHLKGWTLSRLNKIDLAILRVATYEILYVEDIPFKVSINEALELAKEYSEEESRKFINGVLDSVINKAKL